MFLRRKNKNAKSLKGADRGVFVDLEAYDVKGDTSVTKVKVIDVNDTSDMEKVTPFIGHGDVLFVNMSDFHGSSGEFDAFVESMRSQARASKYKIYDAGNGYFVVSSDDAIVKRL